jgi:tRNA nucleotidyltransferase (CCA-adding enzyme)
VPLFLVGGAVRDLLLGKRISDLDLAVEGDGIAFGRALSRELGARSRAHGRFGTATLEFSDGSRLDVATTRGESYERRGALPRVEPAPLPRDLERRDFTVNAMAIRLSPGRPTLVDPFGGARDLERGILRMLHAGSPHDDPTRAFRAVRYANRLGFLVERRTRDWIGRALAEGAFQEISGDRLRRELALLFSERNRAGAFSLLAALRLGRAVDPSLEVNRAVLEAVRRAEKIAGRHPERTTWFLYLLVWSADLSAERVGRLAERLGLAGAERRMLLSWPEVSRALRREAPGVTASQILASGPFADELCASASVTAGAQAGRLERALAAMETRLGIRGRDLIAAGVPAGPRIGRALEATLSARRDGKLSPRGELAYAVRTALAEAS